MRILATFIMFTLGGLLAACDPTLALATFCSSDADCAGDEYCDARGACVSGRNGDGDGAPPDGGVGEPDAGSPDGGLNGDGDGDGGPPDGGLGEPDAGSPGSLDGGLAEPDAGSPGSLDGGLGEPDAGPSDGGRSLDGGPAEPDAGPSDGGRSLDGGLTEPDAGPSDGGPSFDGGIFGDPMPCPQGGLPDLDVPAPLTILATEIDHPHPTAGFTTASDGEDLMRLVSGYVVEHPLPLAPGRYEVSIRLSGNTTWSGEPVARIALDGRTVRTTVPWPRLTPNAVTFVVDVGPLDGPHTLSVVLENDFYAPLCPLPNGDRNLYLGTTTVTPLYTCVDAPTQPTVPMVVDPCTGQLPESAGSAVNMLTTTHYAADAQSIALVGLQAGATLCPLSVPNGATLTIDDDTMSFIPGVASPLRERVLVRASHPTLGFSDHIIVFDRDEWLVPKASVRARGTIAAGTFLGAQGLPVAIALPDDMAALTTCLTNDDLVPQVFVNGTPARFDADGAGDDGLFWINVDDNTNGSDIKLDVYIDVKNDGDPGAAHPDFWTDLGYTFVHHGGLDGFDRADPSRVGTLNGVATSAAGSVGRATRFDGNGALAFVGGAPVITGSALTATFSLDETGVVTPAAQVLWACAQSGTTSWAEFSLTDGIRPSLITRNGANAPPYLHETPEPIVPPSSVLTQQLHWEAALTEAAEFFKDGLPMATPVVLGDTAAWGPPINAVCETISIGSDEDSVTFPFVGVMDEIRISNTLRTPAFIAAEALTLSSPYALDDLELY